MFATIYNSPIENEGAKDLVSHMLHKMDIEKYRQFLSRASKYPNRDHKFVVFEYVESPTDSLIARSERMYRSKMSIHSMITHPDFEQNMMRLFVDSDRVNWYTRRKIDYTKPFGMDQLSDTRQLVLIIKAQADDEYSDMPPLIPTGDVSRPVMNPEEDTMPSLIPLATQSNFVSGVNQTIWSPYSYSASYISPSVNMLS